MNKKTIITVLLVLVAMARRARQSPTNSATTNAYTTTEAIKRI